MATVTPKASNWGNDFATRVFACLACLTAILALGCETLESGGQARPDGISTNAPVTNAAPEGIEAELLRVGDQIRISFSGIAPGLEPHDESIKSDGTITLPLIGRVKAAGRSTGELEREIYGKYVPEYFRRLTVIVSNQSRFFYVMGNVRSPNRHPYTSGMTVLKAIAAAGDFTDFANRGDVEITRANGQKEKVNAVRVLEGKDLDLPIYPGDQIFVPRRWF